MYFVKRLFFSVLLLFFLGHTWLDAYTASVRDQRVVSFFVENLIGFVQSIGEDRVDEVLLVLQTMQLRSGDDRSGYVLKTSRDRLGLYFGVGRQVSVQESDDGVSYTTSFGDLVDNSSSATVYFLPHDSADCDDVQPFDVAIPKTKQVLRETILALLRGPESEEFVGLGGYDLSSYLLDVQLDDGVAYVDLDGAIKQSWWSSSCGSVSVLAMLEHTITGVRGIESVLFAFDGSARAFYEALQRGCPSGLGANEHCDAVFANRSMDTVSSPFAQRRWRIWSNDYSVYAFGESRFADRSQQVYRVCGTGHQRCVSVFDFMDTVDTLVARFGMGLRGCLATFSGRLQWCQLSDSVFVSTLSPWKQLVIVREGNLSMNNEDMVDFLQVIGQ